jgi:hypothetical protein
MASKRKTTRSRASSGSSADVERALIVQWIRKRAASLEAMSKQARTKFADASNAARVRAGLNMVEAGLYRELADAIVEGRHLP